MGSPDTLVRHSNAFLEYLKPLESVLSKFEFNFHREKLKNTTNAVGGTSTWGCLRSNLDHLEGIRSHLKQYERLTSEMSF